MNISQIAAAFVAMVNGEKEAEQIAGRNNLHIYNNYKGGVSLYSYSTPIAVWDGEKVVINASRLSATTSMHQAAIDGRLFDCPVSIILHFCVWGYSESELLKQAAPLYSYRKEIFHNCNGKPYTRFVLHKEGCSCGLHPYAKEQAAKDEVSRLNRLATPNSRTY